MNKSLNLYTKNYFFGLSIAILLLGLIAFSDNFFIDVGQESNSNPIYIIHGLFMYAWIVVLAIQTNHIRRLNTKAHMRLGIAGFVAGIFAIISIAYLYAIGPPFHEVPFFGKANRVFFPFFAFFILFAYLKRDKPELHKHLIFVGMLLIMEPILSRVGGNTGIDPFIIAPLTWITLWVSLFVYDFISKGRIHPLTYLGLIFWFVVYAVVW